MKLKKNLLYGSIIAFSAIGMMQAYPKFNQSNYSAILLDEIEATADDPAEPGVWFGIVEKFNSCEISRKEVPADISSTSYSSHSTDSSHGTSGTQTDTGTSQSTTEQSTTNGVSGSITFGASNGIIKGEATAGGSHSKTESESETIGSSQSNSEMQDEENSQNNFQSEEETRNIQGTTTIHQIECKKDSNGKRNFCQDQVTHEIGKCSHSPIDIPYQDTTK